MTAFTYGEPEVEMLCVGSARAAAIRDLVLKTELDLHREGWGTPNTDARMFAIHASTESDEVKFEWYPVLTVALRAAMNRTQNNFALSMRLLAERAEKARTGGMPGTRLETPVPPDRDVFTLEPGWQFHGLGVRFEAWVAYADGAGEALRRARHGQLHTYGDKQEARFVYLYDRNGLLWTVDRRRGHIPSFCVERPGDRHAGGPLPALSRIVNSVASNDVPIIPDAYVHSVYVP